MPAPVILTHRRAEEPPHVLKRARRTVGAGLRGGAVELLQLELDLEHVPEDQALERCVVRADLAGELGDLYGKRLRWRPSDDRFIVESKRHTQDLCADVLAIVIDAAQWQINVRSCLKIAPKNVRHTYARLCI
jgi:hypothetical protein